MRSIRKIITKFVEWFQPKYKYKYEEDFPESIKENVIYIIGDIKSPWLLALQCPCKCGQIIQLNLLEDADPHWEFKINKKDKISISPSVWRITGCKSHFVLRNGQIEWANRRFFNWK